MKVLFTAAFLFPVALAFTASDVSTFFQGRAVETANRVSFLLASAKDHHDDSSSSAARSSRRSFLHTSAAALLATGTASLRPPPSQATGVSTAGGKIQFGDESIMQNKEHGSSAKPVQGNLLYGVDNKLADRICSYNRRFAEPGGSFQSTTLEKAVLEASGPITFYDSVTGNALFMAPVGRTAQEFLRESEVHGWPSFRDQEVVWDSVRVIRNSGETVSVDGTHLGHNLPDRAGNRYCINLVSVAGQPTTA